MDSGVLAMVRELEEQKKAAVGAEDYDEAKRCKDMIGALVAGRAQPWIQELEERKRVAVEREDYATAGALKEELRELRRELAKAGAAEAEKAEWATGGKSCGVRWRPLGLFWGRKGFTREFAFGWVWSGPCLFTVHVDTSAQAQRHGS